MRRGVGDRRCVMDGNAMTAAGVAASVRASLALGECVGGFGGGAQRRRGWMERCARRQPGRIDRACRCDRADESRHVVVASDRSRTASTNSPMVLTADAWVRTSRSDVGATADAQVRCDALPPGVLADVAARYGDATSDGWRCNWSRRSRGRTGASPDANRASPRRNGVTLRPSPSAAPSAGSTASRSGFRCGNTRARASAAHRPARRTRRLPHR